MRKVKVIKSTSLEMEIANAPELRHHMGICSKTVEDPMMTMSHVFIPPDGSDKRHYHVKCDAGMHILKGRLKMFFGPDYEMEEVVVEEGDFVFVPQGVIHGLINLSDSEQAEMVAAKAGVSKVSEEETIYIEPRED